jgi:hypothetical protein
MLRARLPTMKPFDNRLSDACMDELTKHIDNLFDTAPTVADAIAQLPFNQEPCFEGLEDRYDGIVLRFMVFQALCQREVFRQQRPLEVHHLELPLAPRACAALVESPDHWQQLVGLFGSSLIHTNWSWLHPNFRNYSSCLMACGGDAVRSLRVDPELLCEFPPKRLIKPPGMVLHFADQTYTIGDRRRSFPV